MTGAATLATEQAVLGHTLGFAPMPSATRVYVGLCMAAPVPSEGVAGIEVSGAGYLRMPATFALLSSPSNAAANAAAIAFPPAAAAWGQIGWFEVWDAPSGGRRLYWGQLLDPSGDGVPLALTIAAADIVRFSPGALVIQITNTEAITGGPYLALAGGQMAGAISLAGDPVLPLQAATRQYVDSHVPAGGSVVTVPPLAYIGPHSATVGTSSAPLIAAGTYTTALTLQTLPGDPGNIWLRLDGSTAAPNTGVLISGYGGSRSFGAPGFPVPVSAITAVTDGSAPQVVLVSGG